MKAKINSICWVNIITLKIIYYFLYEKNKCSLWKHASCRWKKYIPDEISRKKVKNMIKTFGYIYLVIIGVRKDKNVLYTSIHISSFSTTTKIIVYVDNIMHASFKWAYFLSPLNVINDFCTIPELPLLCNLIKKILRTLKLQGTNVIHRCGTYKI